MKQTIGFKLLAVIIMFLLSFPVEAQINPEEIIVKNIWSNEHHNAFTDLLYYKGDFYCSFRQGSDHAGGEDGVVRNIKSKDGKKWKSHAVIEKKSYDLHDPKLSVTPDGEMIMMVRRETGEARGLWGRSKPPYQDWTWVDAGMRFGGDNSYPGFVVGKDKIYVSYYSSHEGNSSIYFVEIPISAVK